MIRPPPGPPLPGPDTGGVGECCGDNMIGNSEMGGGGGGGGPEESCPLGIGGPEESPGSPLRVGGGKLDTATSGAEVTADIGSIGGCDELSGKKEICETIEGMFEREDGAEGKEVEDGVGIKLGCT